MAWVKIDDKFDQHPKVEALSDAAVRLHLAGLCYCNRGETDGRIPKPRALRLTHTTRPKVLAELVAAGLWIDEGDFYTIHDYLKYQPSKAKLEEDRQKAAERKARWKAKREAERNAAANGRGNAVPDGGANEHPDPNRPDPLPPKEGERAAHLPDPDAVRANVPHVQATRAHLHAVREEAS